MHSGIVDFRHDRSELLIYCTVQVCSGTIPNLLHEDILSTQCILYEVHIKSRFTLHLSICTQRDWKYDPIKGVTIPSTDSSLPLSPRRQLLEREHLKRVMDNTEDKSGVSNKLSKKNQHKQAVVSDVHNIDDLIDTQPVKKQKIQHKANTDEPININGDDEALQMETKKSADSSNDSNSFCD